MSFVLSNETLSLRWLYLKKQLFGLWCIPAVTNCLKTYYGCALISSFLIGWSLIPLRAGGRFKTLGDLVIVFWLYKFLFQFDRNHGGEDCPSCSPVPPAQLIPVSTSLTAQSTGFLENFNTKLTVVILSVLVIKSERDGWKVNSSGFIFREHCCEQPCH